MDQLLSESFWTNRYKHEETGWDIGYAATPLVKYFDQLTDQSIKILIPGAGNSYEAEYLYTKGFNDVAVIDISIAPLNNFKKRCPSFDSSHIIHNDFFKHEGQYDLIIEQTFFCALKPTLRQKYADHMYKLLANNGKLVGLFFDYKKEVNLHLPPYIGSQKEYESYFKNYTSAHFSPCYNSIEPRAKRELFAIIKK